MVDDLTEEGRKQVERPKRTSRSVTLRRRSQPHAASRAVCIAQSRKTPTGRRRAERPMKEYATLRDAYHHLNKSLFDNLLPEVLITFQRRRGAQGYFSANKYQQRANASRRVHEVALNPDSFVGRTDEKIMSNIAHEMTHVWQKEFGHPARGRYHNREWAAKMLSIGLMPSSTGEPGGMPMGDRVSHYILKDGPFWDSCRRFLERHRLVWESAAINSTVGSTNEQTRVKFSCPNNPRHNAWARPGIMIDCHPCSKEAHEQVLMLPDLPEEPLRAARRTQTLVERPKIVSISAKPQRAKF